MYHSNVVSASTTTLSFFNHSESSEESPENVADFVRNFLVRNGMTKSFSAFQMEVCEHPSDEQVRDVYSEMKKLETVIADLRIKLAEQALSANNSKHNSDKLRRERDHFKLACTRLNHEKAALAASLKAARADLDETRDKTLALEQKCTLAFKEKSLAVYEIEKLSLAKAKRDHEKSPEIIALSPKKKVNNINPYSSVSLPKAKTSNFSLQQEVQAHQSAISHVKFHPKKMAIATVSDDCSWKLWSVPANSAIVSGSGHSDWISGCDFHSDGNVFATCSGDTTAILWDLKSGSMLRVLRGHNLPVWSCNFHLTDNTLATCSLDRTIKLWDSESGIQKSVLKGHADSVNVGMFKPYTNEFFSGSADKTVSMWDMRSGVCTSSFFGHKGSVNDLAISWKGNIVCSCDSLGTVILWDIRAVKEVLQIECGLSTANKMALDPSGSSIFVATEKGSFAVCSAITGDVISRNEVSDSPLQSIALDNTGYYVATGDSNGTLKFFS